MQDVAINRSTLWNIQWWRLAQVKKSRLPATARPIRVIDGQLWCCCGSSGIVILDTELQQQRTVPCRFLKFVRDVVETGGGDIIIAASSGLYGLRSDGTLETRIDVHLNLRQIVSQIVYLNQVHKINQSDAYVY